MKTLYSELPSDLAQLGISALEEWFLTHLEEPVLPFDVLAAILVSFQERGHTEPAETCADFMHDVLAQRGDDEHLLALWELRVEWHSADPAFAGVCAAKLEAVFRGKSRMEVFLRNAGFEKTRSATESLRRFKVLRGLKPGALCWEKTWGMGTVIDIAEYDQQIRIDFEKKKAHQMSLAYAAASLSVLSDDHLLARHQREGAGFSEWVRQDPAGVVKSALHSFGPLSGIALQELLAGRIFPEADWKRFWDTARKQLKNDPLVEFPARRNDPIRLLEREKEYDNAWLVALATERGFDAILGQIEAWKSAEGSSVAGNVPPAIQNRLDFIIQGADRSQGAKRAHALLLADEIGILADVRDASVHLAALSDSAMVTNLFQQLPLALMRRLLLFMNRRDGKQTADLLFDVLPDLAQAPFNEAMDTLLENGAELRVIETMRSLMTAGNATPEMIFWLCRHAEFSCRHGICPMGRLLIEALSAVENDTICGERLKAKHQIQLLLEQSDWLAGTLGAVEDLDRRQFISRLKKSPAWSIVERNAIIYHLTQSFPELQDILAEDTPVPTATVRRLTSQRSYRERQAQLHKLITEEIPQNSRDIATAREYGDLRENFEYKSAREAQGILMRRRLELENMLNIMTGTDFEGFQTAIAGMGTCVTITHGDGRAEHFAILGEWDNAERLGIISSKSKLAEALRGHKPGDQVSIPSETGAAIVTVTEVGGLTAELRAWLNEA